MDKIFEYIKEQLNENSYGVHFDGNVYLAQHTQDEFRMFREGTNNTVELDALDFVPIGLNINEPTKYLGSNKRIQWQKSLYFPIKSDNHMRFDSDNPRLKAIEETVDKLHDSIADYDGVRIGLKVDDLKREQTIPINGSMYVMAVVRIYAEQIERGFFGKEMAFRIKKPDDIEWTVLDVIEIDIGFGAESDTVRSTEDTSPNSVVLKNGGVVWNIDFYLDNTQLEQQITEQIMMGTFTHEYDAELTFVPFDITVEKRVAITQAGKANKKLSVMAINMRLQEVM